MPFDAKVRRYVIDGLSLNDGGSKVLNNIQLIILRFLINAYVDKRDLVSDFHRLSHHLLEGR